jgi:hypothetical protein
MTASPTDHEVTTVYVVPIATAMAGVEGTRRK